MPILKTEEKYMLYDFWRKLWALTVQSHKQIKLIVFIIITFELSQYFGPYILKRIIDLLGNFNSGKMNLLLFFTALVLFSDLLTRLLDYLADKKIFFLISDIEYNKFVNLEQKMMDLSLSYHEKEDTGNKITRIQSGMDKMLDLLGHLLSEIIPTIIQTSSTAIILFFFDWRFGVIFCFFAPIFVKFSIDLNRKNIPYRRIRHDKHEEAAGKMTQGIMNINTVKSFVQENREVEEYKAVKNEIKKYHRLEYLKMINYNYWRGAFITLGRVSILLFGAYLVWTKSITIGSLVFIITISEKAFSSLYRISRLYDRAMDSSEAITRLYDLEQVESEIKNKDDAIVPVNITGQIDFINVSYCYDNSQAKALADINLRINSGCVTALVGPSGGGKTTLAKLIYRHYDPSEGMVKIDDVNIKDYDLYGFRKFIAIVPQEVEIFDLTIKKNIAYSQPQATMEEIIAAAKIANAEEFIDQLNKGYGTPVGERGVRLSGGQRQRIGIARAVLANPKILIFDEATSNLDSNSEKLIQAALGKISKGRTVIIIAHRLSTIKKADIIVVLENGKVVEQGNHYELAKLSGGLYSKLISLQAMGDVD